MREILFRGKTKEGEWVCGDLIQLSDGRRFIVNNKFGACIDSEGNFINTESPFVYEVHPETVGQFTGLTDKNNKEIFEGDILNMHGGCYQMDIREYDVRVKVAYGHIGYGSEIGFTGFYNGGMHVPLMYEGCLTVIGNIHDNPELMEEER